MGRATARFARIAASLLLGFAICHANAESWTHSMKTFCFDTSDQVRLCYSEQLLTDTSTPLLVFIPGWTMPASLWEKQLAYFSGKYSLVAFDPRGQGASAAPNFGYTLERRVQDIKELLDRFPDRSFLPLRCLRCRSAKGHTKLCQDPCHSTGPGRFQAPLLNPETVCLR